MDPHLRRLMPLLLLGAVVAITHATEGDDLVRPPEQLSLAELERRLAEIDNQLESLAPLSMRSGVGAVGYRSISHLESDSPEWIQIEFGEEVPLDQIVLVPTIWRDTKTGFRADGFPIDFRIVVGTNRDTVGKVVASYGAEDRLLPRVAPLIVRCEQITASWVRVEATRLSPRLWDDRYIFQLSEILVFSGQENVALRKPVDVSSAENARGRNKHFLVDGFVPYLMDAQQGDKSIAFVSGINMGDQPELTIDLGSIQPINRIHLHATELSDAVPQSLGDGFGIPRRLVVEGASESDFSDAVRLIEYRQESIYDVGPIIMRRFPDTPCRYVRLIANDPDPGIDGDSVASHIGFAEIELFSNSRNVALGARVKANFSLQNMFERSISALTDGRNFYGNILPLRDWLNDLAQRHDLEVERPMVVAELNRRYAHQSTNLTRMTWLAALLAAGIGFTILIDRLIRTRQLARTKERFAADLHDEIGANLHAIGLLGDLAQAAVNSPEKLKSLLQRIRVMTERSGTAVQNCTNMLEAEGLYQILPADMRRATERIMADMEGEFSFQGDEKNLQRLKPRTRADLFLFYQECLINISRHSGATQFSAKLNVTPSELRLKVSDNGSGLPDSLGNGVPPSLQRRARLLGADVTAQHPDSGGTSITLELPTQKWGGRK